MLKVKLSRVGKKKQPSYRIIIAEARSKRNGKYVDLIGFYNPSVKPTVFKIKKDKLKYWLEKGAQPTDKIRFLLQRRKN